MNKSQTQVGNRFNLKLIQIFFFFFFQIMWTANLGLRQQKQIFQVTSVTHTHTHTPPKKKKDKGMHRAENHTKLIQESEDPALRARNMKS